MDDNNKPFACDAQDAQELNAAESIELLRRLLALAVHKLGGQLIVEEHDLGGLALAVGELPDGRMAAQLVPNIDPAELEQQAVEATGAESP